MQIITSGAMHAAHHLSAGHPSLRHGHHGATGCVGTCGLFRYADGHLLGRLSKASMALDTEESANWSPQTYILSVPVIIGLKMS